MKKSLLLIPILATSLLINCGGSAPKKYKITWKNYNDDFLDSETYNEGEMPTYKKDTPQQISHERQYQYTFTGWDPAITKVSEDKTYKATYIKETAKYTINWKDGNNDIIKTETLNYGTMPKYSGKTPTKKADAEWASYTFTGWYPTIHKVDGDCNYYAHFRPTVRQKHLVKWVNDDEKQTLLYSEEVEYGKTPIYGGVMPKSTRKPTNPEHYYAFSRWDKEIHIVEGPQTYVACYDEAECPITSLKVNFPSDANKLNLSFKCEGDFVSIDWGDGNKDKSTSHTYSEKKEYNIKVKGLLTSFSCVDTPNNGNRYISNIELSEHIDTIKESAFKECSALTSINIPNSVTSIGKDAFNSCSALTSINIPKNVISLGDSSNPNPFTNCPKLATITVDKDNPKYTSGVEGTNAIIESKTHTLVVGCCKSNIPNRIRIIGDYAFSECRELKDIVFPGSVTSVGVCAFYYCTSLENVMLSDNLITIKDSAFVLCEKVLIIYIPKTLTTMGNSVFDYWDSSSNIECNFKERPASWSENWLGDNCRANVKWIGTNFNH